MTTAPIVHMVRDRDGQVTGVTETYDPPADLAASANVGAGEYARAAADPEAWWLEKARRLEWTVEPTQAYDGAEHPFVRWFADGTPNVARNCVDRHVEAATATRRRCCLTCPEGTYGYEVVRTIAKVSGASTTAPPVSVAPDGA